MKPANLHIIHAYRHLYRGLLRAVQYSTPARHTARDILRTSFRDPKPSPLAPTTTPASESVASAAAGGGVVEKAPGASLFDPGAVERTLLFLDAAAKEAGMEHRIVKNLIRTRGTELARVRSYTKNLHDSRTSKTSEEVRTAYTHYEMTIAMLNQSMGLCLRSGR